MSDEIVVQEAKTITPKVSRQKRQRSIGLPPFFLRYVPGLTQPIWQEGNMWRTIVESQPTATLCRETLISYVVDLDWRIEARDSTQRDELKDDIDYYTEFFEYNGEIDFVTLLEWVLRDYLDLPFGSGVELGYLGDDPNNRLQWIEPLDGATLFPYPNKDWPVGQYVPGSVDRQPIYFPAHAINRLYMSPRTKIDKQGWGTPPPEKIYLALEMIRRGDLYYANLLIDTPEAGILNLKNIDQASAQAWIEDFNNLMVGIDPLKIPVLYEMEGDIQYLSFGRPPTELMFDKVTTRYMALTAAGYGMSLSDIGMQVAASGGETLAGSIRQERRTKRTGFARAKKSTEYFFNRMLPSTLRFKWIDLDDELSVAVGRGRLSSITAFNQAIKSRILTPGEARRQLVADGVMTISIPEELPEEEMDMFPPEDAPERPGLLPANVPPSQGGQGEVLSSLVEKSFPKVKEYFQEILATVSDENQLDQWDSEFSDLFLEDRLPEEWKSDLLPDGGLERLFFIDLRDRISDKIKAGLDINSIMTDNIFI